MDTLYLLVIFFGGLGLTWLLLARSVSNKEDWKKEDKSKAIEMILGGFGLIILAYFAYLFLEQ